MKKLRRFLNRFQLQYRRTDPLSKVVVATTIAVCTVTLLSLRIAQQDAQDTLVALQQQAIVLEQENQQLQSRVDGLGTADAIRIIAQEELGLVDGDSIIFELEN